MIILLVVAVVLAGVGAVVRAVVEAILLTAVRQQLSDTAGELAGVRAQLALINSAVRMAFVPKLVLPNKPPPNELAAPVIPAAKPVVMPEEVLAYIEAENEDWARQDRYNRAIELFAEHSDWLKVLQDLRRDDGELAE